MSVTVRIWWQEDSGFYWDDDEDHGGFDRISPMGPFASEEGAVADARSIFRSCGPLTFINDGNQPTYYFDDMPCGACPFTVKMP